MRMRLGCVTAAEGGDRDVFPEGDGCLAWSVMRLSPSRTRRGPALARAVCPVLTFFAFYTWKQIVSVLIVIFVCILFVYFLMKAMNTADRVTK